MSTLITIEEVKTHLKIEIGDTDQDTYLEGLIDLAVEIITDTVGGDLQTILKDEKLPLRVKQAGLFLIGHFFWRREPIITGTIVANIPMTFDYLMALHKQYGIG